MAPKKRSTQKSAPRKKRATNTRARKRSAPRTKSSGGGFTRLCKRLAIVCFVLILALGLTYYFGSYSIRGRMEQAASSTINSLRTSLPWPELIESGLDSVYDLIPHSEGLVVDGGELGHEGGPLLAGVPISQRPIKVLNNKSCVNVFSPSLRSSVCLAYRLTGEDSQSAQIGTQPFTDSRLPQLNAGQMTYGNWQASALVPPQVIMGEFGQSGCNEALLSTQLSPMQTSFADGVWQQLTHELFVDYPNRFDEVWIYTGPIFTADSLILPSGIKVPNSYYAIAYDLNESGGLRAIAFVVPNHATDTRLDRYLTSIGAIEAATGLDFTPDITFDARETLSTWISPRLW